MTGVTLVTGGAGFVGKEVVRQLRAQGEKVRSFDLASPSSPDDFQGSVLDRDQVETAMADVEHVFHLAGNAQLWSAEKGAFQRVNTDGTRVVLKAARQNGIQKFVHCSSLTTLVGTGTPIGVSQADETVMLPVNDMIGEYPRSKRMAEELVLEAAQDGFDAVVAIPTEPIGPGDDAITPPTRMILDFAKGVTPAYIDCILNFVPVPSLAEGMIAVRDRGRRGERYLLGGDNTPMTDLLSEISKLTGRPAPTLKMPYWVALAAGGVDTRLVSVLTGKPPKAPLTGVRLAGRNVHFSSEKAANQLAWRASAYKPALKQMIAWFAEQGLLAP